MGKGKRKPRRPGGHPAEVAAARERAEERRERRSAEKSPAQIAAEMCRSAARVCGPLEAELWVSTLLGGFWSARYSLPPDQFEEYELTHGLPLIEEFARIGGPGALVALSAFAEVSRGPLSSEAADLAAGLDAGPAPAWLAEIGNARIERAAMMYEDVFDDGRTVFLEAVHPDGARHAIGVYVDHNLGVMAKDLIPADSIDRVAELMAANPDPEAGILRIEPLEPGEAAERIYAAMELTDMTLDPPVSEEYAGLRAVALLRADECPGLTGSVDLPCEVPAEERDALLEEFLTSPEGRGFEPGGEGAYAAHLAIDYCCDYVDGRPLRWSPVVVELFMASWLPRKVVADAELLEVLPGLLDAWVRFAGRKRGTPDWAIEQTREAIAVYEPEMRENASDPAARGPAAAFAAAAQEAGVDLTDEAAVESFVAGWNARSSAA